MIQIQSFFSDDLHDWQHYFRMLPAETKGLYHAPEYLCFLENAGLGRAVCQIFSDNEHFIYFPTLLRVLPFDVVGYDSISSWYYGGPLSSDLTAKPLSQRWCNAIVDGRKQLNVICEFIRCDPNLENHALLGPPFDVQLNRETVFVDLSQSWNEITAEFSHQNRRNLKHAVREGLGIEMDNSYSTWQKFADIYQAEMVRKNAPLHLRFDNHFFSLLSKINGMALFVVKLDKKIIGGFIAACGAGVAHHYLSAVQYEHWDKRPNNLLFSKVIEHYFHQGYRLFDFQGGREGVFRFKTNFSKRRGNFYTASCIYDRNEFEALNNRCDKTVENFFPPYRTTI